MEVFVPAEATSVPTVKLGDILDMFLLYRMASRWEVRTQFALSSDRFPVTAYIGGDPSEGKSLSRIDWAKFKEITERKGLDKEPVEKGRLSEVVREFTREVQKALEECTVVISLKLTRAEKEIIGAKNKGIGGSVIGTGGDCGC